MARDSSRSNSLEESKSILTSVGAILAGGASRRFGSPKAFAEVGGRTIIERVIAAQRQALSACVVVTDRPGPFEGLGVPITTDIHRGAGPLGGIHAALHWAQERDARGICCAPCDAPFVDAQLFRTLGSVGVEHDAVIPESLGPLRYEPLFAWYSTRALPAVEACLGEGRFSMENFVERLASKRFLSVTELPSTAAPDVRFMNVNTRADLELARTRLLDLDEA